MNIPGDLDELTALFEKLGAREPASWARSQIEQKIPQLHRFLFLRQAWRSVVDDADMSWMQDRIQRAQTNPDEPYAGVGHALRRCIENGAVAQDLNEIVRGMQADLLFSLCYLLEDPGFPEGQLSDLGWALFQASPEGHPLSQHINGLHESVLETDPTGREMRPRKEAR